MSTLSPIQIPQPQPQAVMQIVLLPGGEVNVNYRGPMLSFVIEGMTGCARTLMQQKIDELKEGPRVEEAPASFRLN